MSAEMAVLIPVLLLLCTMVLTRWVPYHPRWRPLVIALNLVVTARYLWWRSTETLNWDGGWGTAISLATYGAEIYGFLVVLHHYSIATRSVDRTTAPPDAQFSPSVDIFVASYNEGADILTRTLVGCQAIDYPNKRIYLLDDGRRPEIAELCRTLGVNYIDRDTNRGAKAGNLNNALKRTSGDFIVTFDADHVPVSSFLRETLGHFRDSRLAQVQSAHHFFNPDLFQDRLRSHEYIANEQDMFYHIVQPGRDVDNASFFCGSGAVFRRAALDDIGGFPMTTITEDLHTSVLLHSRGWRSIYVNKDLSAGLAPESFDGYVTQRRRWSRGTMQVMLLRGGLFLPGLTLAQRIHYFATLWYWFYGIPRVIYLLAPLFFLLLGVQPLIVNDLNDLLAYYLPHLFISVAAFQLVNRGLRRIFWSDIYESCIAVQMAITALAFPFTGNKVHFAVTPKGNAAEKKGGRRKHDLWLPQAILLVLLVAGLVSGAVALSQGSAARESTMINMFWAGYNLIVLAFGLLLLRQPPQRRKAPRLQRTYACRVQSPAMSVDGTSIDLSETGMSLRLATARPVPPEFDVAIDSPHGHSVTVHCRLVRSELRDGAVVVAAEFVERTAEQHRRLIELMFSAPDSWDTDHGIAMDSSEHVRRILHSLRDVFAKRRALRRLAPRFACDLPVTLLMPGRRSYTGRALDISHAGIGISVPSEASVQDGAELTLIVSWNEYEQTTFQAHAVNVRGERDRDIVGLTFIHVTGHQQADLIKHLYGRSDAAGAERRVA
jgi:cellulose synthase (UDP-forming)